MGLKNITQSAEKVKYNGIEKIVNPGDVIDVRDFNINNTEAFSVEAMIMEKHRRSLEGGGESKVFEQVQTLSNMTHAEINSEILRLREKIDEMEAEKEPLEKQLAEQATEINKLNSDLVTANAENVSLTSQLDEATKELKKLKKAA